MKPIFYTIVMFYVVYLVGCGNTTTRDSISTLDIDAAIDNRRSFDLSEIIDKIDFIALDDDNKESLVGNVSELEESKNVWYLRDGGIGSFQGSVKLFDKSGKYISTRGVLGRGPDEFMNFSDIAADWEGDNLYIWGRGNTHSNSQVLVYDAVGSIIARNNSSSSVVVAATYTNDKLLTMNQHVTGKPEHGGKRRILDIFSYDLQPEGSVEVFDRGRPQGFVHGPNGSRVPYYPLPGFMSNNGHSLFIKETFSDTVFVYKNGVLKPAYILDLGNLAPPTEALGESATEPWSESFYAVRNMWDADRYLIVETDGWFSRLGDILVIDKREPLNNFSAIGPDGKPGLFLGGVKFTPSYIRDNRLVGYMQALDIVDNAATITNSDLKALAATLKEDSNPVIVVATLKR